MRSQSGAAPGRDFKVRDASSYDSVTALFERFTERFTPVVARRMVEMAGVRPRDRVLDIGTGTGVVAFEAANAGSGRIDAIDLSPEMLKRAAARARARRLSNLSFQTMDAESLEFAPGTFDAVFSLFALLHFPNPDVALREMRRVLRPGGRLVIAVGSGPPLASPRAWLHLMGRVPEALARMRGNALIAPALLDSIVRRQLPDAGAPEETELASHSRNRSRSVPQLVRQAGFTEIRTDWRGYREIVQTPEEFWDLQRTYSSFSRKRLAAAAPPEVEAVRVEFLQRCRRALSRGGRLIYHYAALFVAARKSPQG